MTVNPVSTVHLAAFKTTACGWVTGKRSSNIREVTCVYCAQTKAYERILNRIPLRSFKRRRRYDLP